MFLEYVQVLADNASQVFSQMSDLTALGANVVQDSQDSDTFPLALVIEYEHQEEPLKGHIVLGFDQEEMGLALANAVGKKLNLPPLAQLDEVALDILGEFLNTVVGRTISSWDNLGMPVTFGPPSSLQQTTVQTPEGFQTEGYSVSINMPLAKFVFRVAFSYSSAPEQAWGRVLVVDDSKVICHVVSDVLKAVGLDVVVAHNGREAVQKFVEFQPQVTIMDLVMPEMGGFDAIMEIKGLDPKARFIVLTSSSRRDEIVAAKTLGVADYLLKPVENERLVDTVKKVLTQPAQ
jgi:two-component system chemotaxis response regulator CheY